MYRYDIRGNIITVAKCSTCGHEVNSGAFEDVLSSGVILKETTGYNELFAIDCISGCCNNPTYYYVIGSD